MDPEQATPLPWTDELTAGELWVREQLELLLVSSFSPRATARFLVASSTRAREVRVDRPALARRARAWMALGAAAWILPAAAGAQPFRRRLVPGLAWWTLTSAMLDWHLGMLETEDGRPRNLGPADALTLTRAWLVPLAASSPGLPLLAAGAASDVLDGALARRGEPTRAGRDLEGLVDTCFSLAALRGLRGQKELATGAVLAEGARLIAGTSLATISYFGRAQPPEARLLRAARSVTGIRSAGLLAAASGRRRLGDALVVTGAVCSIGLSALALWRDEAPSAAGRSE